MSTAEERTWASKSELRRMEVQTNKTEGLTFEPQYKDFIKCTAGGLVCRAEKKGIKRVYIAGKLSDSGNTERSPSQVVCGYIQNLSTMCVCADRLVAHGYAPYIPGLDFLVGLWTGFWEEWDYRSLSMDFLEVCDAVLAISESEGVKAEVERAKELGIPVCYDISDLEALGK